MSKQIDIPREGKLVRMHDGLYPSIIPRDIRRALNLSAHDRFQWQVEEDGLKLMVRGPWSVGNRQSFSSPIP